MAPRDYAKRGKPPARKRGGSPNRNNKKPVAKRRPWRAIIVTVLLLAAFIWGLVALTGDDAESPSAEKAQQPAPQPVKPAPEHHKKTNDALPPPPQETWQYVDVLENKEVQVKVPKRKKSEHQYQMQCASFRHKAPAESLKAKIAFQGLQSVIKRTENKSGVWYRVVLGPYEHKRKAEHDRHQLSQNGVHNCEIWYWQP